MRRWRRNDNAFRPRPRRLLVVAVAAVALMAIAAWNAGTVLIVTRSLPQADAIVSLASHEWERLPLTARLAAQYPDALVLLTLPQPPSLVNCHDCAHRVDRLRHLGVDPARVRILPLTAPGTHGEALATYTFARQVSVRSLIVATSPYHTRRSLATFESVFDGSGVSIGIAPASSTSPAQPQRWWGTPYDRWYVAYEWAALVYYSGKYGVWPMS